MNWRRKAFLAGLVGDPMWTTAAYAQYSRLAAEAKNQVGENATVCGVVASTHYAEREPRKSTYISLDNPYPNLGKHLPVTGNVTMYRGVPEVVAHEPSQIKVE